MTETRPIIASHAVVIGASTGGVHALQILLRNLPVDFPAAILIVQHRKALAEDLLTAVLRRATRLPVQEAADKTSIRSGWVYVAPADYHLLVEKDKHLSLSIDERVSYARPSIDVLFETAAEAFGECLVGVLLTGANHDGTAGLRKIKSHRGLTIAQDPATAEVSIMPQTAIQSGVVDAALSLESIPDFLVHHFAQIFG